MINYQAIRATLKRGAFKVETFSIGRGESRIFWSYRERTGEPHGGIVLTLADAQDAAALYGFKLNGEGVTA